MSYTGPSEHDLIREICILLGYLPPEQISFFSNSHYLKQCLAKGEPISFEREYYLSSPELVSYVQSLIQFNPELRTTGQPDIPVSSVSLKVDEQCMETEIEL